MAVNLYDPLGKWKAMFCKFVPVLTKQIILYARFQDLRTFLNIFKNVVKVFKC